MKILLVLLIIVGLSVGLWYLVASGGSAFEDAGKLGKASHGKVQVPISASGEARERQRIDIKAEASGTIIEIPVEEGDLVAPGQLLIRLDTEEENRNVERFRAALNQATANEERTRYEFEITRDNMPDNIALAEKAVELAQVDLDYFEAELEDVREAAKRDAYNPRELRQAERSYLAQKIQLSKAKTELQKLKRGADNTVASARLAWDAAKASREQAEAQLKDAERRLRKTDIRNDYSRPCRVVRIQVSVGRLVQSGVTSFGGGDLLMELADVTQMEVAAAVDESDVSKVALMLLEGQQARAKLAASAPDHSTESSTGTNGQESEVDTPDGVEPDADALHHSEADADAMPRARDEVIVTFDALPKKTFRGRIVEIAQKPDKVSSIPTYPVRIRLDAGPDIELIRLGMQGNVKFNALEDEGLCVPYEAVHKTGSDRYVLKFPDPANPRGKPLEREVEVGLTDGSKVVIQSGLAEDESFYVKLPIWINPDEN